VCCLSVLNLETWDQWNGDKVFIEDVMRFLDNVLHGLYRARARPRWPAAKVQRERERSVGLGRDGLPLLPPGPRLPFEGAMAKSWNLKIFKHIRAQVDEASMMLANERGPCPDAADMGVMERFSLQDGDRADRVHLDHHRRHLGLHRARSRPTSTPTRRCPARSRSATRIWRKLPHQKSKNSEGVWSTILERGGSVQHLDFLTAEEKDTFKTSFEIDQRWLIELAADRTPYIDQAQSLNLFIPADVDKWDLLMLHFRAWELGIKSLYYLRSKSVQRAGFAGGVEADNTAEAPKYELATTDYDECLACQ
jgi:ribonucleoside-diphosphate reductase alpha chain